MISLVEITKENFHRFQSDILEIERVSFPSPWSLGAFRDEVNRTVSHLWALISDEKFTGYICFWAVADEIHLLNLAVHPKKRRKGFGRYLLTSMIKAGIAKGVRKAWLEVRPSNSMARTLYLKAGFKETDRTPRYYKDTNEDAIIMALTLFQTKSNGQDADRELNMQQVPCDYFY